MENKHLHIISFDIPYPPNYGGIIDVFYKINALHKCGYRVHLHCFEYNDKPHNSELEKICAEVKYYQRYLGIKFLFRITPYIVVTRSDKELLNNLLKDNFPILYEGLHTSYFCHLPELKNRLQIIRMHNIEYQYYQQLFLSTRSIKDKIFFFTENRKLKLYEQNIPDFIKIATISEQDTEYFKQKYASKKIHYISVFHENEEILSHTGRGEYILFHGNLQVSENEKAVLFLTEQIFSQISVPIIIAGKNPTAKIISALTKLQNIKLVANPSLLEMENLIKNAQINLLTTFQDTGIKLKLINSLYKGRFCIVNDMMIKNTGLDNLCHIANKPQEYIKQIKLLFSKDFTLEEIKKRENILFEKYSNHKGAENLIKMIFC